MTPGKPRLRAVAGTIPVSTVEPDMRIRVSKMVHARIKVLVIRRSSAGPNRVQLHELVDDVLSTFCERFRSASGKAQRSSTPQAVAPMPQEETTTIRVTPSLQAELKEIAVILGRSLQDLVTGVLGQYCDQYESASRRPLLTQQTELVTEARTSGRGNVK